jgi:hypothetical protein
LVPVTVYTIVAIADEVTLDPVTDERPATGDQE